jgi:hypothetical protein
MVRKKTARMPPQKMDYGDVKLTEGIEMNLKT